jgi:DNA-binding PucR family transcriptional regulator
MGGARVSHAPDCALVQFAHLDPATLKTPLICDCDQDDGDDSPPTEEEWDAAQARAQRGAGRRLGVRVELVGPAAEAYRSFQAACRALRQAQDAHAKALAAFTEVVSE